MFIRARPILVDTVDETPFCRLLRFRKAGARDEPRVLLVAPMSGHFSTLLSGTLRTLLQDHEVCLTDWINARDIAPACGRFGFDEYVLHLIRFLQTLGPPTHLVGVYLSRFQREHTGEDVTYLPLAFAAALGPAQADRRPDQGLARPPCTPT